MKHKPNLTILIPFLLFLSATVPRQGAGEPPANGKPIAVTFVDVAEQAGIDFQHFSGSAEKTYILESNERGGWPGSTTTTGRLAGSLPGERRPLGGTAAGQAERLQRSLPQQR